MAPFGLEDSALGRGSLPSNRVDSRIEADQARQTARSAVSDHGVVGLKWSESTVLTAQVKALWGCGFGLDLALLYRVDIGAIVAHDYIGI